MAQVKVDYGPSLEDGSAGADASESPRTGDVTSAPVDWLALARDSYEQSTRFMESSLRWQWERNERSFQNQHPYGSKYLSDLYKYRSKLFRPRTRATMRQAEAGAAATFFGNEWAVDVRAMDETRPDERLSAAINGYLLRYRLTTPNGKIGVPWYMTLMGAFQDARKYGVVASRQSWEYLEQDGETVRGVDPETGEETEIVSQGKVILDRPRIDLIPPENIRIDRSADWRDPINSSPVVIVLWPMYVYEIREKIKTGFFMEVSDTILLQSRDRHLWDSTRVQREGNREDSKESETSITDHTLVWVHENFVRWEGRDYVYYTSGVQHMLSRVRPIKEVYYHADDYDRPIKMGVSLIETHKIYPSGVPQLTEQLQAEANETVNLRLDNIKLALNKRYKVKRGRRVDLRSLVRNISGSITLVDDMDDVETMEHRDVQPSSFAQEDRINLDFDDVAGNFSPGTVQSNRRLNETVGGMQMLAGSAVTVGEMDLRTFIETWAEPVLSQVMRMIQIYETDETIMNLAVKEAEAYTKIRMTGNWEEIISRDLWLRINAGIGATSPTERLQKFQIGAETIAKIFGQSIMPFLNSKEIIAEIFSALGYRDGSRFFNFEGNDPIVSALQQQNQELQAQIQKRELERQTKKEVAQITAQGKIAQQELENQGKAAKEASRFAQEMRKIQQAANRDDLNAKIREDDRESGQRHDVMMQIIQKAMEGNREANG